MTAFSIANTKCYRVCISCLMTASQRGLGDASAKEGWRCPSPSHGVWSATLVQKGQFSELQARRRGEVHNGAAPGNAARSLASDSMHQLDAPPPGIHARDPFCAANARAFHPQGQRPSFLSRYTCSTRLGLELIGNRFPASQPLSSLGSRGRTEIGLQ